MCKDLRVDTEASEHISDRLHRTAQLIRKPKYGRNNIQSELSHYTSSTSSSVKILDQIANPSHRHINCIQLHTQTKIHLVWKSQSVDRRENKYHDLVAISSVQS